MAEIKQSNGRLLIDYMARDYESLLQSMRALIPTKLPEWSEYTSEADFGNVLLQLFAHMGDILSYYQDRVANESFLGTARTRRSIIQHLRLIGYRLATAAPASATLTLLLPSDYRGTLTITKGNAFATKSQRDRSSVRFEYTSNVDLKIVSDDKLPLPLTTDPATGTSYRYYGPDPFAVQRLLPGQAGARPQIGIPVEEGRLVENEVIGTSDGTPNQRFPLLHAGVILRSLGPAQQVNRDIVLHTELGGTIKEWTLQESLAFSRDDQPDFALEIDEQDRATVLFGDGDFGAIPPKNSVIQATYRVGGGALGNVGANTIQTIVNAPQLSLVGAQVTNPTPATGGAERESIEHAVMHAPQVFRSLKRAVTADDYEALALGFNGVGKVRAEATGWNTVTLFVAPSGGGQVSDILEANLLAYFEDKRPVTTTIEIADVDYVKIYVAGKVEVESYYSRDDIEAKVKAAAGGLLAFDKVDFAKPIYLSKFYEAIEAIEGVKSVNITEFGREVRRDAARPGQPPGSIEPNGKILIGPNELPKVPTDTDYAGGIKIVELEGGG